MARPVSLWSPVTMTGRMPAARHSATAALTSSRGGSIWPISPSSVARPARASKPPAASSGSSATVATASTRSARPAMPSAASRAACSAACPSATHRRSTASGAPLMNTGAARRAAWRVAIILVSESNGSSASRGHCCRRARTSMPALPAATSSAASVGSPSTVHCATVVLRRHELGVVAQHDGLQQRRDGRSPPAATGAPASVSTPCGA